MNKDEMLRIAKIAVEKNFSFEKLKYSDDMYGREELTDDVWEFVEECKKIGTIEFNKKYGFN